MALIVAASGLVWMPTAVALPGVAGAEGEQTEQSLRFRLTLSTEAEQAIADLGLETPITGRAYVIVSRTDEREPRLQTSLTGVPLWGVDVSGLSGGESVMLDSNDIAVFGYPLEQISEIPDGSYFVQAFLNIYTTFERSDGHVLRMHLN